MSSSPFRHHELPDADQGTIQVERGLASIYRNPDGTRTNLRHLDRGPYRGSRVGLWVLVIAVAAGITWWFLHPSATTGKFGEEVIEAHLVAPTMLKSGESGTWQLDWKNTSDVPLRNVEVTLERSNVFVLGETQPALTDLHALRWSLPDTPARGSGLVWFRGVLWDTPEKDVELSATLTFTPGELGARFDRRVQGKTHLSESVVRVSVDGPTQVIGGGEQVYTATVENTGALPVTGLKIAVTPPVAFTVSTADPDLVNISGVLAGSHLTIPAASKRTFELKGSYVDLGSSPAEISSPLEWKAEVFVRAEQALDDALQGTSRLPVSVVQGDVLLTAVVAGSAEPQSVALGSRLPIAVSLTNRGSTTAEDVVLTVTITPQPAGAAALLDWDHANIGSGERTESGVVFSPTTLPALANIDPKKNIDVHIDVPIKTIIDPSLVGRSDIGFTVGASAVVGKTGGVVSGKTYAGNVVSVELNSDLTASSAARYFSDENLAIGSGPLPPRVGEVTKLHVSWKLTNALHELSGLSFTAALPANIEWTGNARVSAGTIRFDGSTREVRWSVNRMPTSVRSLEADFELSLTPTSSDVGHVLVLLKKTAFQAEDILTHAVLSRSLDDLTSNISGDPFGAGKGVVVQ